MVRAYDTATGSVQWQAEGCNEGGVTCLAFAGSNGLLCSGPDGQVCCLDPSSGAVKRRFRGSKHAVSGAAASPDGSKLLLGGSTLALWDLAAEARIAKFTGHTMPVRSIAFAPTGNHALSAAASERSIAVWNTSGSKRAKKLGGVAVASLALDDPAISLCTCGGGGDDGSFYAAAVTEAGEVFVWLCTPEGEGALVGVPVARVRVGERKAAPGAGPAGSGDVVLAAGLEAVDGGATLVVVRGNTAKPTFERVPIAAPAAAGQHQQQLIALPPLTGGVLLHGSGDSKQQQAAARGGAPAANGPTAAAGGDVEMLGPENDGALVRPRAAAAAGSKKRDQPEHDDGAAAEGDEDDDEEDGVGR